MAKLTALRRQVERRYWRRQLVNISSTTAYGTPCLSPQELLLSPARGIWISGSQDTSFTSRDSLPVVVSYGPHACIAHAALSLCNGKEVVGFGFGSGGLAYVTCCALVGGIGRGPLGRTVRGVLSVVAGDGWE